MKKDFVFISDFDGTITEKDFYLHILDNYIDEQGTIEYKKWRSGEIKDIDFLSYTFNNINLSKEKITEDILKLKVDVNFRDFVKYIQDKGGDFKIVSAGSSYYIDIILKELNMGNIDVYSNKAIYKNKGIYFDIDPTYEFYSDIYGIDKKKVVESLRSEYNRLYYAGDSEPDFEASLLCDFRFAKGRLVPIMKEKEIPFYSFDSFLDVKKIMELTLLN